MVRVMKSPNMMSTTGRRPVIAAPTARPVKPASEIGVSITRSVPNSSTSPDRSLNGVPASATSSPKMQTLASRRISSASASRTACAKVSSRWLASGINVLLHFFWTRIGSCQGKLDGCFDLGSDFRVNAIQEGGIGEVLFREPGGKNLDRIALGLPVLLLLLRAVVFAIDVADVMAAVSIGIATEERGTLSLPRTLHEPLGGGMHGPHVLSIHALRLHSESDRAGRDIARRGLGVVGVLGVEIVLANVEHWQLPELRSIHYLVEQA